MSIVDRWLALKPREEITPATSATSATFPGEARKASIPLSQPVCDTAATFVAWKVPAGVAEPSPNVIADYFEERAAIIEEGAGVPREWAEGFARLCVMPCPDGIAPRRWCELVDAAGAFIDRWAASSAALGWSALDVFGVHRRALDARQDLKGLVWFVHHGETVEGITATTATIRNAKTGGALVYVRRPSGAGQVCVWEISP